MNEGMTANIQSTINATKAEYCRIKDYQAKLTADFTAELSAINMSISALGNMLNPIALINNLLSTATGQLGVAQADLAAKITKYNQLMSDLNDKVTVQKAALQSWYDSLSEEAKAMLPHLPDGSFDMDAYCTTLPNVQKEW